MSDDVVDATGKSSARNLSETGIGLGYIIYQQVAGVIGAFALIAFLGNFVHIDWRGALGDLIGLWDQHVRPAVKLVFDLLVVWPIEHWLGWRLEVPLAVRDYFSVGVVQLLSFERLTLGADLNKPEGLWAVVKRHLRFRHWLFLFMNLVVWPYQIALDIRGIWAPRAMTAAASRYNAIILAPFAFFLVLLIANFLFFESAGVRVKHLTNSTSSAAASPVRVSAAADVPT